MTARNQQPSAAALIKAAGQRATRARIAVLDTLLRAEHTLTHHEVEQALRKRRQNVDRVTLYRVLDWALDCGLVHMVMGEDRVRHFGARSSTDHAHFNCTHCGLIYCLDNRTPTVELTLPKGFKPLHTDISVQGVCPHCTH